MAGSAGPRLAAFVGILTLPPPTGLAGGRDGAEDYPRLVERYGAGDREAADFLASALGAMGREPRVACHGREECEAAAVLNLDAAAILLEERREDRAGALLEATHPFVARQAAGFALDWLLAAAALRQAYGNHSEAFTLYQLALGRRPRESRALLGRATALEFSAIPDGFGGVVVADRDVWRELRAGGDTPAGLSSLLADPKGHPYRRLLLEHLTRLYRRSWM
jgi:hypothetical protein